MTTLDLHKSSSITKLLLMGDPGSRKTSALVSLVAAGYKLGIIDFDNLLDPLKRNILAKCPQNLKNVHFKTFRDKQQSTPAGPMVVGTPTAFNDAMKFLDNWKDGEENLGKPSEWGPEWILVVDSVSRMSDAAVNWGDFTAPGQPGKKDGRQIIGIAQEALRAFLSLITSEWFNANVIVMSHITYQEDVNGLKKGYPLAAGQKLSPNIPSYFSSVLHAETLANGSVVFRTVATPLINLKNGAVFDMPAVLPWDTGLATFFAKAREVKLN